MITNIKKIALGIIVFTILTSIIFHNTQKARALFGLGDIVFDPTNVVQTTLTAGSTALTAASSYSIQFKEYVLDPIASGLAKVIIRQLTQSVVQWINSGFEGSPAFVTNPGSYFLDLADQVTGDFLQKTGGPLAGLCSPFSIDIRIALNFKYHPNNKNRYTCTLGTIITNSKNAIKGASINGFTAGDFSQGGWPAFFSLTTEPQNNAFGAYLEADRELSFRIANLQSQKSEQLNQGRGFLSWQDPSCLKAVKARAAVNNAKNDGDFGGETEGLSEYQITSGDFGGEGRENSGPQTQADCPVKTPGSFIVDQLGQTAAGPLRELELADELNEIVNALFAQLVTQVLSKGLGSVSGSGPSDRNAYINQITNEDAGGISSIVENSLPTMSVYLKNAQDYKTNKSTALNIVLGIKTNYQAAIDCNTTILSKVYLSNIQINRARNDIIDINSTLSTTVNPLVNRLLAEDQEASKQLQTLLDIQTAMTTAKTAGELQAPTQKFEQLLSSQSLITANKVLDSKNDLDEVKSSTEDIKSDSQRKLQQCNRFE